MDKVTWTLVTRAARGRYFHPVDGVPSGLTWQQAVALARPLSERRPELEVWYVPDAWSQARGWPEDRDNILLPTGRRLPIRWDSMPQASV